MGRQTPPGCLSALNTRPFARVHGLTFLADETIHVSTGLNGNRRCAEVAVHRTRNLAHITTSDGFRLTDIERTFIERTFIDMSADVSVGQLGAAIDQAFNLNVTNLARLSDRLDSISTRERAQPGNELARSAP